MSGCLWSKFFLEQSQIYVGCVTLPSRKRSFRAFFSGLLRGIIARNKLPLFKMFSNFVHFCPNFQIFCPFLPFSNIFLPFFFKISRVPWLSRIGPAFSNRQVPQEKCLLPSVIMLNHVDLFHSDPIETKKLLIHLLLTWLIYGRA